MTWKFLLSVLCALAFVATSAWGQESAEPAARGRIPVRVIEGKLVTSCDVSTRFRRLPVNLFIELESKAGLQLHNRAAGRGALDAERGGVSHPITIHFPGLALTVPSRELGPEEIWEDFTKYHSVELGENALVGTIGAEVLAQHHLTLDIGAGYIEVAPPRPEDAGPLPDEGGGSIVPMSSVSDVVWLAARDASDRPTSIGLGTARYDSLVERQWCEALGKPAGDVGALTVGDVDLSKYVAFRPDEIKYIHPDGADAFLGLGALLHLRIELDRVHRQARIVAAPPPPFPEADLAFFRALVLEERPPLVAYLEEHPESRLAGEAAERWLELCIEDDAPEEELAQSIAAVDRTTPKDLRTTLALERMKELVSQGLPEIAIAVADHGVEGGRDDRYPDAVHELHGLVGELLLDAGENRRAWRHLLSGAFGKPEDGRINLNLGRYYEGEGRLRRAFSRYVQAAIDPASGQEALLGLARVQEQLDGSPLSVDRVQRLLEGKVQNYTAATTYEPDLESATGRVVLVEWFTSAHHDRGGLGGALGNEALLSHFPREHVAALNYHLPIPELVPLTNQLVEDRGIVYGIGEPGVTVINGRIRAPGAARTSDKEKLYQRLRDLVVAELARAPRQTLSLDARLEDGVVRGTLKIEGAWSQGVSAHVVLAERGVLFPGKNEVVVQRMVARAALTPAQGVAYERTADGRQEIAFEARLDDIREANEAYLDELEAAGRGTAVHFATAVDPEQVTLVAFLQHDFRREVLQAVQVEPVRPEPEDDE